jgi:hypothetical protein
MDLLHCLCFVTDWCELGPLNLQDHKSWFWSGFLEVLFFPKTPSIAKFMWLRLTDESASGFCSKTLKRENYCTRKKTAHVTLSISKPMQTDLISKQTLGLTGPAIIHLRHGTVLCRYFGESFLRSASIESQNLYALIQIFYLLHFLCCIMYRFEKVDL